jgi:hypothetical protein
MFGGLLRPVFLEGVEGCADQHDCRDDDEARQIPGQRRDRARRQQNQYEWVAKPTEELQGERQAPPLLQHVGAAAGAPRIGLGSAETISIGVEL